MEGAQILTMNQGESTLNANFHLPSIHPFHALPQIIPYEMFTHDGYINDQSATAEIPYARLTSNHNGCGWIAVFNVLRHLELEPPTPEIVAKEMMSGVLLRGHLGTWPPAIIRYLRKRGYDVRWTPNKRNQAKMALESNAAIFLYLSPLLHPRDFHGHYVMLYPLEEEGVRVFNYGQDPCIMPLEQLTRRFNLTLMIGVK